MNNTKQNKTDIDYKYGNKVPYAFGAFVIVALIGWAASAFLSGVHFWALPLPDGITPSGSMAVITSSWGYLLGIPLAFLGSLYYLTVISAASLWYQLRHPLILKSLTILTATGVVFSAFFVYLQLVPIGEICPFCMISAGASTTLFILELYMVKISDLPSFSELISDWENAISKTALIQVGILISVVMLMFAAFYGINLAPIPGV